jgi:hypothetical protein
MGLGIASLAVGAVGLVLALIPCVGLVFGLPVAVVGLLLGVAALIVAFARGGQGLAFPISGAAVSLVAMVIPLIWWLVIARTARRGLEEVQAKLNAVNPQVMQQGLKKFEEQVKKAQEDMAKVQVVPVAQPQQAQPLLVGQPVKDMLTNADIPDRRDPVPRKTYKVKLQAGRSYQIDMVSEHLDSFLRLEDPSGIKLAENDDLAPQHVNSRIQFACLRDGDYRITATTPVGAINKRTGSYTLSVQPTQGGPAPKALAPLVGQMVFKVDDRLTDADPKDDKGRNSPIKTYPVKFQAGKTYQIDMMSSELDSLVRLEGPNGVFFEDDDAGGFPNARLVYECHAGGEYRITALRVPGSKNRSIGSFTLTVQQK